MRWGSTNGWIGLDVGTRAVKVAQLTRRRDRLVLSASAVSLRGPSAADDQQSLGDCLLGARALASGLRGSRAAAALSMEHCRVEATDPEAAADASRIGGRWQAGPATDYTLSTESHRVEKLVEVASSAGWQCDVVDGAPLALARVLRLTEGYSPAPLLGALDWGQRAVTFVAASDGVARYTRRLNVEGFETFAKSVGESLGLSPDDAAKALRRQGVQAPPYTSGEQRVIHDAVRHAIRPLALELQRTLEHLGGKLRSPGPERVFLFGAGGAIQGLASTLGMATGLACEPWTAPRLEREGEQPETPDCLLAQAIALSALVWEPTT